MQTGDREKKIRKPGKTKQKTESVQERKPQSTLCGVVNTCACDGLDIRTQSSLSVVESQCTFSKPRELESSCITVFLWKNEV